MWYRSVLVVAGLAVATSVSANDLTEAARQNDIAAVVVLDHLRLDVGAAGIGAGVHVGNEAERRF